MVDCYCSCLSPFESDVPQDSALSPPLYYSSVISVKILSYPFLCNDVTLHSQHHLLDIKSLTDRCHKACIFWLLYNFWAYLVLLNVSKTRFILSICCNLLDYCPIFFKNSNPSHSFSVNIIVLSNIEILSWKFHISVLAKLILLNLVYCIASFNFPLYRWLYCAEALSTFVQSTSFVYGEA